MRRSSTACVASAIPLSARVRQNLCAHLLYAHRVVAPVSHTAGQSNWAELDERRVVRASTRKPTRTTQTRTQPGAVYRRQFMRLFVVWNKMRNVTMLYFDTIIYHRTHSHAYIYAFHRDRCECLVDVCLLFCLCDSDYVDTHTIIMRMKHRTGPSRIGQQQQRECGSSARKLVFYSNASGMCM